jgi:hypothetical protein
MKREKWYPVHWVILGMGLCMILLMIQFNYIMDHCKPIDQNIDASVVQDTLIIEQSHEYYLDE